MAMFEVKAYVYQTIALDLMSTMIFASSIDLNTVLGTVNANLIRFICQFC